MRTDTNHEVGKLINYFENCINDLNKDFALNSKTNISPIRTTSQNTTFAPTNLPTIIDDEDIYDQLTYQTIIPTNSYSSHEQLSIKSVKRRRHVNTHHTTKKRLHRRRPPTYIKELKAYLAHRESSINDLTKINDIKKFSNVLVWLSNQTTSPSLIETSTPTSLQKIEDSPSITPDSVIATTQSYSDPTPLFIDEENTSKSSNYLTYDNITWKLKIRKEVFSPTETFNEPSLIELLYLQIVQDIFSSVDIRISEAERTNMKTFLSSHGVSNIANINLIKTLSIKKDIIEQARQWSIYFSRLFPISLISKTPSNEIQILGISHSGIRLIKRNRMILQVLETYSFDLIQRISSIENESTISLYLAKKKITIYSPRIRKMQEMIHKFLKEFHLLSSSSSCDLFKSSSQISLMSCSELDIQTPNSTGYSMMEFALQNFQIPNRRQSKKNWKTLEWTWQDYTDLLKWSKIPIQMSLLRQSSNISSRIVRQCFLAVLLKIGNTAKFRKLRLGFFRTIMRFMGDYTMARNQTEISCVFYLLKNLHKQRKLIDEVLCQLFKQMTENKSMKTESLERGWKLLIILLNYFIPSEDFQPYFIKYLNDHRNENEKLVKICLDHYEQTMKYGGRKVLPNKAEIELLISTEGKRQVFLLPGGFSITLVTTPSMIINDCLHLLCEHLNISEIDEYSIFIISTSKHSSRLLIPTEYLFDILNEYNQSNITNYHFIIKRILWYHIPISFIDHNQSDMFIDFMYHQLLSELLDGKIIVLNNNHQLSEQLMEEISMLIALQYRASNKIGLPSMKVIKSLLPGTVLKLKNIHSQQWIAAVHEQFISSIQSMSIIEAKIKFLNLIQTWPLFGTTLFSVESIHDRSIRSPCFIGINKNGLLFLNFETRETMFTISYNDVISIRRHQMTIDIKHGHLTPTHHLQCQVNRAQEFVALTGRYLKLIGRKKKSDTQQIISTHNDSISTIL